MDVPQIVQSYVDDVLSGRQVAGELQRLSVERYCRDLNEQRHTPYYFDADIAAASVEFFPACLRHTTDRWAGQPFELEREKVFVVWNLQGWRRRDNRARRFKQAHIECARKWGKTTFCAGLSWECAVLDGVQRPEIYLTATKRRQSLRCFDEVVRMREHCRDFQQLSTVKESEYVVKLGDGGVIEALGCDGGGSDGLFPSTVIFDELHEWKSRAHLALWKKMRTGSSLRSQPLFVIITTAGDDDSKLWLTQRDYAVKVLRGEAVADHVFAFILCIDDDDDAFDESCWPKANPLVFREGFESVLTEYREKALEAQTNNETARELERYYTNRRVESINRAISDVAWKKGRKPLPILSGRACYGAADLGWRDDIAAAALSFPPIGNTDPHIVKAVGFLPEDCARDLTDEPFPELIKTGRLIITPGNTTDTAAIHSVFDDWRNVYSLKSIAVDPNNAREFGTQLVKKGLSVYEFQQSCRNYNEPFREFLKLLSEGRIIHGDCPLLEWCRSHLMSFSNPEGLIMPSKKSSPEKIDPMVAVIMAFAESLFHATRKGNANKGATIRML